MKMYDNSDNGRPGTNFSDCFDQSKLTVDEQKAIATVLGSPARRKMMAELIIHEMCKMSAENAEFFAGLLPNVISEYTRQARETAHRMRHALELAGPIANDYFLRNKDISNYDLLVYVMTTWNFKKAYEDSINFPKRYKMLTTKDIVEWGDVFASRIIGQFRRLVDGYAPNKPVFDPNATENSQFSYSISTMLPDLAECLTWCKNNRKIWDTLPKNWKPDFIKKGKKK